MSIQGVDIRISLNYQKHTGRVLWFILHERLAGNSGYKIHVVLDK